MTEPVRTIVIGVDGSPHADEAFAFAVRLAQLTHARLVAATVYAYRPPWGRLGSGEQAMAVARAAAATAAGKCVFCNARIVPAASAAEGIAVLARAEHADLVVLGSRHRGRLGEALPGQVGHGLLRDPAWPVALVASGEPAGPLRHVGVLPGGAQDGPRALAFADRLAAATGAGLRVYDGEHSAAPGETCAADDLAAGQLDVLVVPDWPHGLVGRLRRRGRPARRPVGRCVLILAPPASVADRVPVPR